MKNHFLYSIKAIAAYFVIFIHCLFPSFLGSAIDSIARFAVPVFFIISGFYNYNKNYKNIAKSIKKIFKLTCITYIIYFTWFVIVNSDNIQLLKECVLSWFSIKTIIKYTVFNIPLPGISTHLWYLGAILYCYISFAIINKVNLLKLAYISAPILIMIHLFLGEILSYFNIIIPIPYLRNFLLIGFPFFMMGNLLAKHKERIEKCNFSNLYYCIIILLGLVLTLIERHSGHKNELYAGSVISSLFLVIYAIQYPAKFINTKLEYIGKNYSLFIYIMHPIFITLLNKVYKTFGLGNIDFLEYILPIFVCIFTTIGAILFYIIYNKSQMFFNFHRSK